MNTIERNRLERVNGIVLASLAAQSHGRDVMLHTSAGVPPTGPWAIRERLIGQPEQNGTKVAIRVEQGKHSRVVHLGSLAGITPAER